MRNHTAGSEPYSALAAVYGSLMHDTPYAQWISFILERSKTSGLILDIFGGQGTFSQIVRNHKRELITIDKSISMLTRGSGSRLQADAKYIPVRSGVAAICTATNCSINYLASAEELQELFAECARVLKGAGLLVFDYCTPERALALSGRRLAAAGNQVVFSHEFCSDTGKLASEMAIQRPGSPPAMEFHSQTIFSSNQISETLSNTGFSNLEFVPNYGLPTPSDLPPIMTVLAERA